MTDDDLELLMRSPALTLEPPASLAGTVRRHARRRRLQLRAISSVVAVTTAAAGLLLGPGIVDSARRIGDRPDQSAGRQTDPRFPAATTDVVTLQTINGASVLTWFQGADWCTATTRVNRQQTCLGPVNPDHQGFSWVVPARSPSVTVDDQHVVAGIVPPGASRVLVHMTDGREFQATVVDGARFPRPVWAALLIEDPPGIVDYYAAFDPAGREIARKKA